MLPNSTGDPELALCWIHEYRHYKTLIPRFTHHCTLLQDFGKAFWKLYHRLLDYRSHPDPVQADALQASFDQLFAHTSGYQQLDECKARTLAKKDQYVVSRYGVLVRSLAPLVI